MEEAPRLTPRTVEGVFRDFKGRRAGLIKALTCDAEKLFQLCDPERENLCLYGLPNETWEVNPPPDLLPPDLPKPALGIKFARDKMNKQDWLLMIAAQSDSWLLAVAFCICGLFDFEKKRRKKLFQMINELPTIYEVVKGNAESRSKAEENEDGDEFSGVLCGTCGANDDPNKFWICCDVCEIWFHGMCVKVTPAKAEHLREFNCPCCSCKRAQASLNSRK